jgi:hypothetical protein
MARIPTRPADEATETSQDASERREAAISTFWRGVVRDRLLAYLSPDWRAACLTRAIEIHGGATPLRIDPEAWAAWLRGDRRGPSPMDRAVARIRDRHRLSAGPIEAAVERFRAKVAKRLADGWVCQAATGSWRPPTIIEQAERLALTHADQAAQAGIVPSRADIARRFGAGAKPSRPLAHPAPIPEAERWAAARAAF